MLVAMAVETEKERLERHSRRALFDGVAELYDASRWGYPGEVVEFVVATAGLSASSETSSTRSSTGLGPACSSASGRSRSLSAASMGWPSPSRVVSFEDLEAAEASFDLIVSGTAFHWVTLG